MCLTSVARGEALSCCVLLYVGKARVVTRFDKEVADKTNRTAGCPRIQKSDCRIWHPVIRGVRRLCVCLGWRGCSSAFVFFLPPGLIIIGQSSIVGIFVTAQLLDNEHDNYFSGELTALRLPLPFVGVATVCGGGFATGIASSDYIYNTNILAFHYLQSRWTIYVTVPLLCNPIRLVVHYLAIPLQ